MSNRDFGLFPFPKGWFQSIDRAKKDADMTGVGVVKVDTDADGNQHVSWVDPAAIYKDTGLKATNPKDAIGALKAKVSVVPANVIFEIGLGMTEGMVKYGRHNYRGCGVRASVYYDASMGHLMDWWEGEDTDPDSGLSHVTKALASLVVLRDAMMQDKLRDDRPPRSKVTKRHFNPIAEKILKSHADKDPHHWTIADDITEGGA